MTLQPPSQINVSGNIGYGPPEQLKSLWKTHFVQKCILVNLKKISTLGFSPIIAFLSCFARLYAIVYNRWDKSSFNQIRIFLKLYI